MRRFAPWIALVIVLLVGVRISLPFVLARVAADQLSEALSAHVEVEDVDLRLIFGVVTVKGLAIRSQPGEDPWLGGRRATVDIGWPALLRGDIDIEAIEVDGLRLALVLDESGRVTWAGAPPPEPESPEEPEEPGDSEPTRIRLESISLTDIDLGLRDQINGRDLGLTLDSAAFGPVALTLGEALEWSVQTAQVGSSKARLRNDDTSAVSFRIALTLEGLGSKAGDEGSFDLSLGMGDGQANAKGTFSLEPLSVAADIDWNAIALSPLLALAPSEGRPEIADGMSSGAMGVRFEAAQALTGSGHATLDSLDLTVPGEAPLQVVWKQLSLDLSSLVVDLAPEAEPPILHLSKLTLDSPVVRATRAAASAGSKEPEPESGTHESSPAPRLQLDALRVSDGKLRLRDATFDPPLDTSLSKLSVTGRGLRWPEAVAQELEVVVGSLGTKPLTATFAGRRGAGKGTLRGERISLLAAAPYVRQNSSYAIERGALTIDAEFETEGEHYEAPTRIVLHDLVVDGSDAGSQFQSDFGVSLEMALALLRDTAGDIVLDLPIEGERDGAGIGVTRVLADTMRRVLVNALASPLKLAGGLLDGDDAGDSFRGRAVFFEPGEAEPLPAETSPDGSVAALLAGRPDLGIRLEAVVVSDDLEQVAERAGVEPGEDDAPSAEAQAQLERLARERLAITRQRVAEALGEQVENAESRLVIVPWKGRVLGGRPRVEGRLVLHSN